MERPVFQVGREKTIAHLGEVNWKALEQCSQNSNIEQSNLQMEFISEIENI